MRVAGLVDCFGYNRKTQPFLPINRCSYFIVRPTPHALLALKHRITADASGIKIGAEWPEDVSTTQEIADENVKKQILQSVLPVKHANFVFRHVVVNGEEIEVFPDVQSNRWVGSNGKAYQRSDVKYKFFSSNTTKACLRAHSRAEDNDEEPDLSELASEDYLAWCVKLATEKCNTEQVIPHNKVIDVDNPAGRDMIFAVENVYYGKTSKTNFIPLPPLFYRTKENVKLDKAKIARLLVYSSGKDNAHSLPIEKLHRYGVLLKSERVDGVLKLWIGITKKNHKVNKSYLSDEVDCIEIPDKQEVIQVLVTPVGDKVKPGEYVDKFISPYSAIIKLVPEKVRSIEEAQSYLGDELFTWAVNQCEQHCVFHYNNATMYPLKYVAELPEVVNPNEFWTRNRRFEFVADVLPEVSSFVWKNKFVDVDLLHHAWYHPSELQISNPRYWPNSPTDQTATLTPTIDGGELKGGI